MTTTNADVTANTVLDFWFGNSENKPAPDDKKSRWYMSTAELDQEIKDRFEASIIAAGKDELLSWHETANGLLATIILLDQFTRNIYRRSGQAFAQDSKALAYCKKALATDIGKQLGYEQQVFLAMPLEHSEDLADQNLAVEYMQGLLSEVDQTHPQYLFLQNSAVYAVKHRDIIAEFGRFPHRNAVLDRTSTAAEVAYLQDGGATFGQ